MTTDQLPPELHPEYGSGHCAIPECARPCKVGHLMCPFHWRLVPRINQRIVYRKWGRWLNGEATVGELRAAQAAAVQSVTDR